MSRPASRPRDLPSGVEHLVSLARLSTLKTGGAAEFFARVHHEQELVALLSWACEQEIDVSVLGSGSNVLIADEGVPGLVLKLDRGLARLELDGSRIICGAAVRLPSLAARAAREGLSGIEFGVNIPGTVGGAVRMNAGAYGGQLAEVLQWVDIATAAGMHRSAAADLRLGYRRSSLRAGEIVALACFALTPAPRERVNARLAELRAARHAAQPSAIRTFGSTFRNPSGPDADAGTAGQLLAEAGCNGLEAGGARFAPKHANFVENMGDATTADVVALMAEGRRRVLERFDVELEPEVQVLGPVRFPW